MKYDFFLNLRSVSDSLEYCYDVVMHLGITKTRKESLCTIKIILKKNL